MMLMFSGLTRALCLAVAAVTLPAVIAAAPAAAADHSTALEDQTWTELAALIKQGTTTVIIPVGGTEQTGPYVALGKHNARVKVLADRIARNLGNALVAPVIAYVPEGEIDPPTGHMRFPGTLTVPPEVFRKTVEAAALSLRHAGFRDIVLIGDHGGYQKDLQAVAEALNKRWSGTPARAHYEAEYYRAAASGFSETLKAKHYTDAEIGTHAGLNDTSLELATNPDMVRQPGLTSGVDLDAAHGVYGNPQHSSAELGRLGVDAIVDVTTKAIKAETSKP